MGTRVFKILIVGRESVGKASLINMYKSGTFSSVGPLSTYFDCFTNYGKFRIQLTQSHTYEDGHDAIMIIFDLSRHDTMKIIESIPHNRIPRVLVGNKYDLPHNQINSQSIRYQYYYVSVKRCHYLDKPLLFLLQRLVSSNIRFR